MEGRSLLSGFPIGREPRRRPLGRVGLPGRPGEGDPGFPAAGTFSSPNPKTRSTSGPARLRPAATERRRRRTRPPSPTRRTSRHAGTLGIRHRATPGGTWATRRSRPRRRSPTTWRIRCPPRRTRSPPPGPSLTARPTSTAATQRPLRLDGGDRRTVPSTAATPTLALDGGGPGFVSRRPSRSRPRPRRWRLRRCPRPPAPTDPLAHRRSPTSPPAPCGQRSRAPRPSTASPTGTALAGTTAALKVGTSVVGSVGDRDGHVVGEFARDRHAGRGRRDSRADPVNEPPARLGGPADRRPGDRPRPDSAQPAPTATTATNAPAGSGSAPNGGGPTGAVASAIGDRASVASVVPQGPGRSASGAIRSSSPRPPVARGPFSVPIGPAVPAAVAAVPGDPRPDPGSGRGPGRRRDRGGGPVGPGRAVGRPAAGPARTRATRARGRPGPDDPPSIRTTPASRPVEPAGETRLARRSPRASRRGSGRSRSASRPAWPPATRPPGSSWRARADRHRVARRELRTKDDQGRPRGRPRPARLLGPVMTEADDCSATCLDRLNQGDEQAGPRGLRGLRALPPDGRPPPADRAAPVQARLRGHRPVGLGRPGPRLPRRRRPVPRRRPAPGLPGPGGVQPADRPARQHAARSAASGRWPSRPSATRSRRPRPRPSEVAQADELWDRILATCPPAHRELLRLKREGLAVAEIAERTGLHPSSVRRILYDLARRLGIARASDSTGRPKA